MKVFKLRGDLLCPPDFHFLWGNESSESIISATIISKIPKAVASSSVLSEETELIPWDPGTVKYGWDLKMIDQPMQDDKA